jgi:hypothetical protein
MDRMSDNIYETYLGILRRLTPEQKLQKVFELADVARELFCQGLRNLHPGFSQDELKKHYLRTIEKCYNRNY